MKQAIQKAIEGGYPKAGNVTGHYLDTSYPTILLQPLFWQALGKSMGWSQSGGHICSVNGIHRRFKKEECHMCDCNENGKSTDVDYWKYHWHRFIDHLAEGKDAESFFKELLK